MSWKVVFEDEDGTHTNYHDSYSQAMNWIRAQEARVSSGEEFELIDGPTEIDKSNFSDRLRKCFVCIVDPLMLKRIINKVGPSIQSTGIQKVETPKVDVPKDPDGISTAIKEQELNKPKDPPKPSKSIDPNTKVESSSDKSNDTITNKLKNLYNNHKGKLAVGAAGLGALAYVTRKKKKYV